VGAGATPRRITGFITAAGAINRRRPARQISREQAKLELVDHLSAIGGDLWAAG